MKKIELNQMENLERGTKRQCMIDGGLTWGVMLIGVAVGGIFGDGAALMGGLYAANSNGCFN